MNTSNRNLLLLVLIGVGIYFFMAQSQPPKKVPAPQPKPVVPEPEPNCPNCPRKPWGPKGAGGRPVEGGRVSPDGQVQLTVDLPESERKKNIASKGLGCCVFRSLEYAGRWQGEKELFDLPEKMVRAGIEGGGYPEKVDKVLKQLAPHVRYVQHTGGDPAVLDAILKSGRMACVTYDGHDCHYSGSIAHMVCSPCYDRQKGWVAVSDNNFIKSNQFVWMSPEEFNKRWKGNSGGWAVCLLGNPPPPPPHN